MTDHATPNLPSRDFAATSAFYATLGFVESWRDEGWMILKRGDVTLEFFPHPGLDPLTSSFSCCLRLDDLDAFYAVARMAGIAETCSGQPRLHPPRVEDSGIRIAYMVDSDGTLVRVIQNRARVDACNKALAMNLSGQEDPLMLFKADDYPPAAVESFSFRKFEREP